MSRRKRMLENLDQDIRDHIETETQDNIGRGMPPQEARYAALAQIRQRRAREGRYARGLESRLARAIASGFPFRFPRPPQKSRLYADRGGDPGSRNFRQCNRFRRPAGHWCCER